MKTLDEKARRTVKIYPIFEGISLDLLFYVAVKAHMFYDIKHFTSSQINTLSTIGFLSVLVGQLFINKTVRKVGRKRSMQIGVVMMIIASSLFAFVNNFSLIAVGEFFYHNGCVMRGIGTVIYANDLKYLGRFDEYLSGQNKSTMLYAIVTFIISLVSGFLYNIYYLLPMILCVTCCVINFIFTFFIYEVDEKVNEETTIQDVAPFTSDTKLLIITYGLLMGLICVSMDNGILMIKQGLNNCFNAEDAVLLYSFVLTLSRAIRIGGNFIYKKINKALSYRIILITFVAVVLSFGFGYLGETFDLGKISVILLALSYYAVIFVRDGNKNYFNKAALLTCEQSQYTKVYNALATYYNLTAIIFMSFASIALKSYDFNVLMAVLLVVAIISIIPAVKTCKILKNK